VGDSWLRSESAKLGLWDAFCTHHALADSAVPLFAESGGTVVTSAHRHDHRVLLRRSDAMEAFVIREVSSVLAPTSSSDGVLYLMLWLDGRLVLPLYIGKAGRYGRSGGVVSANLLAIDRNSGKFARWGSNYAYHIGDLSAAVCPGHASSKITPKYRRWAERLFVETPSERPRLRRPVLFWCTAWSPASRSIWTEFGATSLAFEEYLLIGVASLLFPKTLLNTEGVNRPAS
jgi:hypothetical protein